MIDDYQLFLGGGAPQVLEYHGLFEAQKIFQKFEAFFS